MWEVSSRSPHISSHFPLSCHHFYCTQTVAARQLSKEIWINLT